MPCIVAVASFLLAIPTAHAGGPLPTCSLDGQPMVTSVPSLIGVSTKELNLDNPDLPDISEVATWLSAAHVTWVGNKIHWEKLEPVAGDLQWQLYDARFEALLSRGLTPVVTLRGTAPWASTLAQPRDQDHGRCQSVAYDLSGGYEGVLWAFVGLAVPLCLLSLLATPPAYADK